MHETGEGLMAPSYEHRNESSCSIKSWEFVKQLRKLVRTLCWTQFVVWL
jgi:hypothetical protein